MLQNLVCKTAALFMLILVSTSSEAQKPITVPENRYGLKIIDNQQLYSKTISQDSSKRMVNLKKAIPTLVFDLRYATTNNFTNKRMYPKQITETYLRLPVAKALLQVQQELSATCRSKWDDTPTGPVHPQLRSKSNG